MTAQTFYALQDTKTPAKAAVIAVAVNILLSLILMGPLKHGGLALATSVAAMVNLSFLIWVLRKRMGRINMTEILGSLKKMIPANLLMGGIAWFITKGDIWATDGHIAAKTGLLAGSILLSVISYGMVLYFLKSEELVFLWRMFRGKKEGVLK